LSKKEVVEVKVGEIVVLYNCQVRTIEHIFDIGIRGDAMRTSSIRSRMGIVMEGGVGESSVILATERGLRRGRGERGNSVVLSGHADS